MLSRSRSARSTRRTRSLSGSAPEPGSPGAPTIRTSSAAANASSGPATSTTSTSAWIPALDGVEAKLTAGARIADVGCGHGASTLLLAQAYPASSVVGFDADQGSVDAARKRAADAGLTDRVRFETAAATTFDGAYDLVCFFDCLHDMGDPIGACAHVHDHLAPGGTLMLIEPFANDDLSDNLNPVGAAYYGFSTLLCTPSSLSQEVGTALGAQAGEARLREIVTARRVHDTAPRRRNTIQHRAGSNSVMKFVQIIEFKTSRIDDFNANLDAWITRTEGNRIPHHAVLSRDRDTDNRYLLMVEFASHDTGMENSNRPETSEFAADLAEISDRAPDVPQPRRDTRRRPIEAPPTHGIRLLANVFCPYDPTITRWCP